MRANVENWGTMSGVGMHKGITGRDTVDLGVSGQVTSGTGRRSIWALWVVASLLEYSWNSTGTWSPTGSSR